MNELGIMLIDDEPHILDLSFKTIQKMGYGNITTCHSGQSALEIYRESNDSFDIIICDLNMPEMNGVEFLRHISDENYLGGIILLSSVDERILESAKDLAKARHLNVLGYIVKPLKQETLQSLLSKYSPQKIKTQIPLRIVLVKKNYVLESMEMNY